VSVDVRLFSRSNSHDLNTLPPRSNDTQKVIYRKYTPVLFSRVFAATQPRTVLTSLPTACTPPRGSNSRRNIFRINTYKSLSKQTTLTVIESYSYKKHRGWGALLTRNPKMARVLRPGGDHRVPIAGSFYPDRPNLSRPGRELLGERRALFASPDSSGLSPDVSTFHRSDPLFASRR